MVLASRADTAAGPGGLRAAVDTEALDGRRRTLGRHLCRGDGPLAVPCGEALGDDLGDDLLERRVDELLELGAMVGDVLGDELPCTIDDLRVCPSCTVSLRSLPQLYRQLAIGTLAPVQQKGDDPL